MAYVIGAMAMPRRPPVICYHHRSARNPW